MANPKCGEIWLVDIGLSAKVRPCFVLSTEILEDERALVTVIAHTTQSRNSRFEVDVNVKFLRRGVFDAQNIVTIPKVRVIRKLGMLLPYQISDIENAVRLWLGL